MKPWRTLGRALASGTVTMLLIVLAPAVLLFGELVNRHYLCGLPPGRDRILVRRRHVVIRHLGPGRAAYAVASGKALAGTATLLALLAAIGLVPAVALARTVLRAGRPRQ